LFKVKPPARGACALYEPEAGGEGIPLKAGYFGPEVPPSAGVFTPWDVELDLYWHQDCISLMVIASLFGWISPEPRF
jgi:hypothetical protein